MKYGELIDRQAMADVPDTNVGDTISRQAAIDAADRADYTGLAVEDVKKVTDEVVKEIKKLPSAQPGITLESAIDYLHSIGWMQEHDRTLTESAQPERKKGKWIGLDDDAVMTDTVQCSVCRKKFTVDADRFYDIGFVIEDLRFCPNCGADMRGETDE